VEIPGGEVAILPELIRGHPSPHGFDLTATCFGTVALDRIVTGERIAPGDALIGLPSSGLHSNSYSLARKALPDLAEPFGDGTVADALLAPTVIYVRAALDLLRSDIPVHGLAHITGGGLLNLLRLNEAVGFAIEDPLPVPAIIELVIERAGVSRAEAWEVFNMGCGFAAIVPADYETAAAELLAAHHPGSRRIGTVTGDAGRIEAPGYSSGQGSRAPSPSPSPSGGSSPLVV
jgi:phosphoribosylformylglycinamidine cyclo-ligase